MLNPTHLEEKAEKTKTNYSKRKMDEITKTTYAAAMSGDLIQDRNDLTRRITDIITKRQRWIMKYRETISPNSNRQCAGV